MFYQTFQLPLNILDLFVVTCLDLRQLLEQSALLLRLSCFFHDQVVRRALKSLQSHSSDGVCHFCAVRVLGVVSTYLLFVGDNVEVLGERACNMLALLSKSS